MNVILYVFDALRADYLGCYGYDEATSPNLDKFASENVLYRNAYSTSTWTKPAAASLLTGCYPRSVNMLNQLDVMSELEDTLPKVLRQAGFDTYTVSGNMFVSPDFGFDDFDRTDVLQKDPEIQQKRRRTKTVDGRESEVLNTVGTDEVVTVHSEDINERIFSILEENPNEDKFILAWATDTHGPYYVRGEESYFDNPVDAFIEESEVTRENLDLVKSIYKDMIRHNDEQFGRLLDRLEERGEYHDSMVIAAGDHGEAFGEHETVLGRPITGHTGITYEEQIKVPLIMKYPGDNSSEERSELVQLTDIYPTVLDALDVSREADSVVDGQSLFPPNMDVSSSREIFAESKLNELDIYSGCVRKGDEKLIQIDDEVVMTRRWKRFVKGLLHKVQIPSIQLYDLAEDPGETNNIASEREAVADRLLASYSRLVERCDERADNVGSHRKSRLEDDVSQHLKSLGYLDE